MRKVTIVVPVLITSCHGSDQPNSGPDNPHTTMISYAMTNTRGRPAAAATLLAIYSKKWLMCASAVANASNGESQQSAYAASFSSNG